ncbi:MAG: GNAT family N-acetyltransferase [Balneolaceae bacterium]|nr:GNAT family N-acetyltransferase [Balneolaceae bacterium]
MQLTGHVDVRPLLQDDHNFLRIALYHAIHIPPGADAPPPEIVDHPELALYVDRWMQRPGDMGFKAEFKSEPIGAIWLRIWGDEEQGFGFLEQDTPELSMSVLPGYRGQGIGTLLLHRLLETAESRFKAISLSVSISNPALRLYKRTGFIEVSEPENGTITMVKTFG